METQQRSSMEKLKETFKKMIEDKEAIKKCIRKGGNIGKVIKERKIIIVKPL